MKVSIQISEGKEWSETKFVLHEFSDFNAAVNACNLISKLFDKSIIRLVTISEHAETIDIDYICRLSGIYFQPNILTIQL